MEPSQRLRDSWTKERTEGLKRFKAGRTAYLIAWDLIGNHGPETDALAEKLKKELLEKLESIHACQQQAHYDDNIGSFQ